VGDRNKTIFASLAKWLTRLPRVREASDRPNLVQHCKRFAISQTTLRK